MKNTIKVKFNRPISTMEGSFGAGQEAEISLALARPWLSQGVVTALEEVPEAEDAPEAESAQGGEDAGNEPAEKPKAEKPKAAKKKK